MGALLHQRLLHVADMVAHNDVAAEIVADAIVRLMAQERCFRACGDKCQALDTDLLNEVGGRVANYAKRERPEHTQTQGGK